MSWRIVPQIEKHGRDQEEEVLCRAVKFTPPVRDKSGEEHFFRLRFPVLRVILAHDSGVEHHITWSNRGTTKHGMYTYKWGVKGVEDDQYASHDNFWAWMRKNRAEVAEEVKAAFEERIKEAGTPKPPKAKIKKYTQTEVLVMVAKGELTPEQGAAMLKRKRKAA